MTASQPECPLCRAVDRILTDIGLNSDAIPAREFMDVDREDLCPEHQQWADSKENDWYDFGATESGKPKESTP